MLPSLSYQLQIPPVRRACCQAISRMLRRDSIFLGECAATPGQRGFECTNSEALKMQNGASPRHNIHSI